MNTCDEGSDDTIEDKAESVVSEGGSWIENDLVLLNLFGDFGGISRSYKTATELRSS